MAEPESTDKKMAEPKSTDKKTEETSKTICLRGDTSKNWFVKAGSTLVVDYNPSQFNIVNALNQSEPDKYISFKYGSGQAVIAANGKLIVQDIKNNEAFKNAASFEKIKGVYSTTPDLVAYKQTDDDGKEKCITCSASNEVIMAGGTGDQNSWWLERK